MVRPCCVDLKFVSLSDAGPHRDQRSVGRDGRRSGLPTVGGHLTPDLQWLEDRFWVWVHYVAPRLAGRLLEL
jgi:hypothetical protein